jgi:hypothetical protein
MEPLMEHLVEPLLEPLAVVSPEEEEDENVFWSSGRS